MGNSASSANPKVHSNAASHLSAVAAANQVPTPHRDPNKEKGKEPQRKPSESPAPDDPNGTLKTRKKSLELPDLALLSLAGPYSSRGRQSKPASTPISIPQPPKPSFNDYSENLEKPARQTVFIDSSEHLTTTHHYEAPAEDQYGGGGRAPRQKERVRDREKEAQIEREDEAQRERDREQRRRERREQRHQQQQRAGGSGSGATAAPRGRQQPMPEQPNAVARLQDLYERSNQPIAPRADGPPLSSTAPQQRRGHDDQPEDIHRRMAAREQEQRNQQQAEVERRQAARRARYTPEVVRSSIPILLGQRGEEGAAAVAAAAAAESSRGPAPLAASASITFGQSKTGKGKAAAKMALTQIDEAVEGLTIDVTEHQEAILASTATDGVITLEDSTGDILRHDPVEVTIIWKGGGDEVILARAGDNEWRGRTLMDRLSPTSNLWSLSIFLKPGTHHLRFLVDGQWRVADDLPAAVDDQGSLANYVAVPFSFGNETAAHQIEPADAKRIPEVIKKVIPGQSFWSAESSADGEDDETPRTRPLDPNAQQVKGPAHANPALIGYNEAKWTNVIPAALIEAQREEEQYLAATNGQYDSTGQHGQRVTTGFIPAPNIPPAPSLPRHLDKLILNSKLGETKGKEGRERRRERDRDGNRDRDRDRDGDMGGIGSGQAGRKRDKAERQRERELERAERQREKERLKAEAERDQKAERLRASMQRAVPQAPPPSEYGDDEGPKEDYVVHPIEESHRPLSNTPPPTQPRMGLWDPRAVAAILPPGTMMPPPGAMQTPGQFGMAGGGGYDSRSGSPRMFLHGTPGGTPMYAGQIINQGSASSSLPAPTPSAGPATTPIDVATPVPPSGSSSNDGSGSRLITLDNDNVPNVTDDTSVLPVPTHVVLHHLCTSAIKNGVLAVATTTRYRKKYLTTVYYKPSHPNGSV